MALKLPPLDKNFFLPDYQELEIYSQNTAFVIEFQQIGNQLWLKSDIPKERPIGILIDETLERHLAYFKKSTVYKENLAKALGIKPSIRPKVLDLTAGLLGDSLMMLAMGCEVTALERHPVVSFLIQSALNAATHPLLNNFTFHSTDALSFLESSSTFEVIYFDPMFEDANLKAGAKKEMRIFREMIGSDQDAELVFKMAREKATRRLVVKRPRLSRPIVNGDCLQYEGKSTRYDTYLNVK
ncbi:MAG TPA: class I SAM-dependent methyltransferase [Bacteriovoracaceae bacterium]|nr:class I SAM-dependent methyltransferase [Bacteriovoracaceae bacterium]